MDIYAIAADKIKEKLSKENKLTLIDTDLLGVQLRQKVFWPDRDKEIYQDPMKRATSTLLAKDGATVFWLLLGGLVDSKLGMSEAIIGGAPVSLGFGANALLNFHSFTPHAIRSSLIPDQILDVRRIRMPFSSEAVKSMLPGTVVSLEGQGVAKLSGSLVYGRGLYSVEGGGDLVRSADFSLRLIRRQEEVIRVVLEKSLGWEIRNKFVAKVGPLITADSMILKNIEGVEKLLERIDPAKVGFELDGRKSGETLFAYLTKNGVERLDKLCELYTVLYAKYGAEHIRKTKSLVAYDLDLRFPEAEEAYLSLLRLNEEQAAEIDQQSDSVTRMEYSEDDSLTKRAFEVGLAGRQFLLAQSLRGEREGVFEVNNETQLIRFAKSERSYTGIVTGSKKVSWEGLEVRVNEKMTNYGYWHFSSTNVDKMVTVNEFDRMRRFAKILGVRGGDDAQFGGLSWYERLKSDKDDHRLRIDLYFTSEGLANISNSLKSTITKTTFNIAEVLKDIPEKAPWGDYQASELMLEYLKLMERRFETEDLQVELRILKKKYRKLLERTILYRGEERELGDDARVLEKALLLNGLVERMRVAQNDQTAGNWAKLIEELGHSQSFSFMILIGTLSRLAGSSGILLDCFELEALGSEQMILYADETNTLVRAEGFFARAEEQIAGARIETDGVLH